MKSFLSLLLLSVAVLTACNNNTNTKETGSNQATGTAVADSALYPVITFEKETHNFGNIVEGEVVEYSFKFTNTGNKDLLITKAEASCGCTVPEWPKEPVKPGESGYMKVKFDSRGRPEGYTEKELYIQANTNPPSMNGPKIQCTIVKK
jgi:hypothetical protein